MKTSMYFRYTLRTMLRGGQRTVLAVFCVAVGVMAIVALQSAGFMLKNSLSSDAREAAGGDITVTAQGAPLNATDLAFFSNLKETNLIADYTALATASGTLNNSDSVTQSFNLEAVDPGRFPLVSAPDFVEPANGKVSQLLRENQVIVTQNFLAAYHKQAGDTFSIYVKTAMGSGQTLRVKIGGVIANTQSFAQAGNLLLISLPDYLASAPAGLANYSLINITMNTSTDQARTDGLVEVIGKQFPLVSIQKATDLLKSQQSSVDLINKFLEVAGLIALLIGGVGIINTMQVLLSRRKTEIAMLKTAGYRRTDLYLLFGLEAALLGALGGLIGTIAGIGASAAISNLLQNAGSNVSFELNLGIILGGIGIGCVTALIFGVLPIVKAANIRPLQVLRQVETGSWSGRILTMGLLGLFSILFCGLATVILNNDLTLGIVVTYATFAFLLLISAFFSLIVFAISKLPVPERLNLISFGLVIPGLAFSGLVYQILPVFGIFLVAVSVLGLVVPFLPGTWKADLKMALRNIGRHRGRTTATVMALYIGIWGIGIDIGIGQDLKAQITGALAQNSPYNLVATSAGNETAALHTHLNEIAGLSASREAPFVAALPLAINGSPAQQMLPTGPARQAALNLLGGVEGYDLARTTPAQIITEGRNLNAADANTDNVIVSQILTSKGWAGLNLKPGDTLTFASLDGKTAKTVTIVGIISVPTSYETLGKVLAPVSVVTALNAGSTATTTVFYMKIGPTQTGPALETLSHFAPNASVQNLSDAGVSFLQQINSFLDVVLAIASLSLLAAVIIIANSVALAMLERQREMGILKAVGYNGNTILKQILIENSLIGGVGTFVATLQAAGGVTLASKFFFNNNLTLSMEPLVIVSMLVGPVLLAMFTALLIAWKAVRVRPLLVLKYE